MSQKVKHLAAVYMLSSHSVPLYLCTSVPLCGYTMDMVYMDIAWIFYSEREQGKHGKHEHSVRDSSRTIVLGPLVPGTSGTGLYLSYSRPSICNGVLTPCSCPLLPLLPLLPTLSPSHYRQNRARRD